MDQLAIYDPRLIRSDRTCAMHYCLWSFLLPFRVPPQNTVALQWQLAIDHLSLIQSGSTAHSKCRIESQELSQPEEGWMVGIPKNRKLLAEIKVTLEIDGSRSDRRYWARLTDVDWSIEPSKSPAAPAAAAGLTARMPSVWPPCAAGLTTDRLPVRPPKPSKHKSKNS